MKMSIKTLAAAALVFSASVIGQVQSASAVPLAICPDNATLGRSFTLDPSTGCYAYGEGNINGNVAHDPILNSATMGGNTFVLGGSGPAIPNLVYLDASNASGEILDGALGGAVGGVPTGVITVSGTSGWSSLILGIKTGDNLNPAWAAFRIAGDGSYTFGIIPGQNISHAMLYGVSAVPIPAAGFLLIGGLGGLAALRRRRKKA